MEIYFVKHGQTPSAFEARLSGDSEGLSAEGRTEAKTAAQDLKKQTGDRRIHIVCSPRIRTRETAEIIAGELGISAKDITYDERLVERDCSPFLGQRITEVFSKDESELVAGGMEPLESVYARSKELYNDIKNRSYEAILLVGHSGNLAPLVFAAQGAWLGDNVEIPKLALDQAIRLQ